MGCWGAGAGAGSRALWPQDYCSRSSGQGSFSIITENVPCGTTGVTCSKAIKIFLGVSAAPGRGQGEPGPPGPLGPAVIPWDPL